MSKRQRGYVEDKAGNEHVEQVAVLRLGWGLSLLDTMTYHAYTGAYELVTLRLKLGILDQLETLAVVTAIDKEGLPVVGFHTAMSASEALVGAVNRINNGQMKWRKDEYHERNQQSGD